MRDWPEKKAAHLPKRMPIERFYPVWAEKKRVMPCFFKSISTFAPGQREI
jgi:hypothetical protein